MTSTRTIMKSFPTGLEVGITDFEDDGIRAGHQDTFTRHCLTTTLR
jgi:hypothetical protein